RHRRCARPDARRQSSRLDQWRARHARRLRAHRAARRGHRAWRRHLARRRARGSGRSRAVSSILLTLHDVEPAVRLNARLEGDGHTTALVSPLDDIRAEIRRAKPELIVLTGELHDAANIGLLREQLWAGTPVVGLTDGDDLVQ